MTSLHRLGHKPNIYQYNYGPQPELEQDAFLIPGSLHSGNYWANSVANKYNNLYSFAILASSPGSSQYGIDRS